MIKISLLILCSLAIAFACHASCECAEGSSKCVKCKFPGSEMDEFNVSCPCPSGYYNSSLSPYTCSELMKPTVNTTNNQVQTANTCNVELGMKIKAVEVETICKSLEENGKSFVQTTVNLNVDQLGLTKDCYEQYVTKIQYQDIQTNTYKDLPLTLVESGKLGSKTIKIPLIEVSQYSKETKIDLEFFIQELNFAILIGSPKYFLRSHKFRVIVQTNRKVVEIISVDTNNSNNNQCLPSQECITIDKDCSAKICSDEACASPYQKQNYIVGDKFYAQVKLIQKNTKQQLKLAQLLFKDDNNKIYNLTASTKAQWSNDKLILSFTLPVSAKNPVIEIQVAIQGQQNLRSLNINADSTDDIRKIQFASQTSNNKYDDFFNKVDTGDIVFSPSSNSQSILLFALAYLSVFFMYL